MFKIGEFSKLIKVPIKTLRYYDELGIFKPIKIDRFTGYRYYSASQLDTLNKILSLKDIGFSLEQIKYIIENNVSSEKLISMLKMKEIETNEIIKANNEKLNRINSLVKMLNNKEDIVMNYNVVIKKIEPTMAACLRDIIPDYSAQHDLWCEMAEHLNKHNIKILPGCGVIYHDPGFKESNVDMEIVELTSAAVPETDRIKYKELPGYETVATLIHKGFYDRLSDSYTVLLKWIEENGYKICGPNMEIYIAGEWCTDNPDEYITEIQIPVQK